MSFTSWWGTEAYQGDQFLVAIVVDPSRTDAKRYGMVVIAAPDSAGRKYKPYWVAREEDMSGWTISAVSGSVFVRQYRDDAAYDEKSLAWYRSKREFRLKSLQ
ncbi:MAG TPA: hypothetical protein VFS77_21590 [Pyrinomonadaceae bacterium]|nr:hypothetical protein [Pyrinomonadaceae bacterium]